MRLLYSIVLTALVCVWPAQAQEATVPIDARARVVNLVTAVSAGADAKERGAAITKRLDEPGIKYGLEPFTYAGREGNNIVAELSAPAAGKQLMLGALYLRQ